MALLAPFLPYLLILFAVGGLWGTHKLSVWNAGRAATSAANKVCDAKLEVIRKRASDLALLWSAELGKGDLAAKEEKGKRDATFGSLAERAAAVQRGSGVTLPFDVTSVRRSATTGANAARSPSVGAKGADSISGPAAAAPTPAAPTVFDEPVIADDEVKKAAAYADAYGQWKACVTTYDNLRKAQPKEK